MSKHTPGPWSLSHGSHVCGLWEGMIRVEAPEVFHTSGNDRPDGGSTKSYSSVVCGVSGSSTTAVANARLIAAAPDLLAACQKLVMTDKLCAGTPAWLQPALDAARAAIAKAEGGAP